MHLHTVSKTNVQKKGEKNPYIPFRLTSASAEEPDDDKVSYIHLQYDTSSITKYT